MGLTEYAKSELDRLGKDKDGMQEMINRDILEIIEKFGEQGHSGFSANYVIQVIERLLRWKPIKPLTGEDDEWSKPLRGFKDPIRQNKRCSSVFKYEDGHCEDIDAIIVSDNGGHTWYNSGKFRKTITFPYTPPIRPEEVYIEYTEPVPRGFTGDKYEIITDKPERIKALYDKFQKEMDEACKEERKNDK